MARYSVETKLDSDQVMEKAVAYFGPEGVGLQVTEQASCCAHFVGGGGHVHVTVVATEPRTTVELETREWDYDVKQFMHKIA